MVQFVVPGLQQLHQIVQHHSKVHEVCVHVCFTLSSAVVTCMCLSLGDGVLHGEGI